MSAHKNSRTRAVAPLLALPLVLALSAPVAAAGTDDPIPAVPSPSAVTDFSHPTRIDNRFFPLVPGTKWVYEGSVTEAGETVQHTIVFTVTNLTKVIDGVSTRVVWDVDYGDGELEESELAFFAQDDDGNVWNFGEYPEEYADGAFEGAPSLWITGMAGAKGGPHMLADPEVGDAYEEGLVRSIEFYDVSEVASTDVRTCVPEDCYNNVLYVNETSPLDETGGTQTKYYAPNVGLVRIGATGGDAQERMTLSSEGKISDDALDRVNREVRRLDEHGREISNLYARTNPVK